MKGTKLCSTISVPGTGPPPELSGTFGSAYNGPQITCGTFDDLLYCSTCLISAGDFQLQMKRIAKLIRMALPHSRSKAQTPIYFGYRIYPRDEEKDFQQAKIFESPAFTFYVGHEKRVFNVHIGAIRHHSRPLEVLMTGPMSEAQNGCAHLPDVDVDTFARFVQFAYMGDYGGHPAQFAPRQKYTHISSQAEQPPKLSARRADDSVHTAVQKGDVSPSNQQSGEGCRESCLLREFRNLTFCHRLPFLFDCRDVGDSIMNTVLRHAETYVFADTYQIERLRKLALAKAHAYLRRTSSMSAIHVVELVKYTLHNTMDSTDSPDELRKVVMIYLACVVDQLIGVKEFLSLLENEPSLSVQLIPVMVKRFGEK